MTRYLVTGGLGVVGSLLTRQLSAAGHEVFILDAYEEPRNWWTAQQLSGLPGVTLTCGRIEVSHGLRRVVDKVDAVIHAAAHTGIPHSTQEPDEDWTSNVDATRCLLEALRVTERPIPTVIMSSVKPYRVHDMHVMERGHRFIWPDTYDYATNTQKGGIHEHWPLEPDEPYAASKMAQSALAMAYARSYDLPIVTLRFSNLYGPAPCHGPRHGWLTWMTIAHAMGRKLEVQGSGRQVRDMLYSSDINAALLTALSNAEKLKGQVFNVGGGAANSVSVLEAVEMIGGEVVAWTAGRKNEDPIFITDYSAFKKATDWEPRVGVKDGIASIAAWAHEHRADLEKIYERV